MLLDDKNHLVELFIENIIWGNIKFDRERLMKTDAGRKVMDRIDDHMLQWMNARVQERDGNEFEDLTDELYYEFITSRLADHLKGTLSDRDSEKRLTELSYQNGSLSAEVSKLKKDNTILANELNQLRTMEPPMKSDVKHIG